MEDKIELFAEIFALSLCSWGIYSLYNILRLQTFIVRRYEEETELLNTVFFKDHVTFSRYLPGFLSSALYGGHLLMCVWGWRLYGGKKVFRDISNPDFVTHHFSQKEIRRIKTYAVCFVAIAIHGVSFLIFRVIWPETFS
jgi:hypothetical protein